MPGVFAAGDVRQRFDQARRLGGGEGATVVRLVHEQLREADPERPVTIKETS